MSDQRYFGMSILAMGRWVEKGQTLFYFGRVGLMATGALTLEFFGFLGFNPSKIFNALNIFSGNVLESPAGTMSKVVMVLAVAFIIHYIALFMIGWEKHKRMRDGDDVVLSIFEDINTTVLQEKES